MCVRTCVNYLALLRAQPVFRIKILRNLQQIVRVHVIHGLGHLKAVLLAVAPAPRVEIRLVPIFPDAPVGLSDAVLVFGDVAAARIVRGNVVRAVARDARVMALQFSVALPMKGL